MVGHCDSRYKRIQPLSNCQLSFGGKRKYYRIEDRCLAIPTPVPQHDKMQAFFFFFFTNSSVPWRQRFNSNERADSCHRDMKLG